MEEIHVIENASLEAPCELPIRTVDVLQPILLVIASKLVVIQERPSQCPNNIDIILVDGFERLAQEGVVVKRSLKIIELCDNSLRTLHERVEPKFGDENPRRLEGVPDVAELLTDILRCDVCVAVSG